MGYRAHEVDLPDPVPYLNRSVKIHVKEDGFPYRPKRAIARSLGPHLVGLAPPYADAMDQRMLHLGAQYRFCRGHEVMSASRHSRLKIFTLNFCQRYLKPLAQMEIDYPRYLQEETHYNEKQRQHYLQVFERFVGVVGLKATYKAFGKIENLRCGNKYKHVRCINPPPDEWKVFAAPWIHFIEKEVCHLPWFAKYVPVIKRPQFIRDLFATMSPPYVVTDYTSFESSMTPEVYNCTEGVLISYMLSNNSGVADNINCWNTQRRTCKFRDFSIQIEGVRMSGDPNTSLGNGWVNLIMMAFLCHEQGLAFKGLVEGDDGLFSFSGPIDLSPLEELGFQVKAELHDTIYDTSFCGLMLSQSLAAFADPRVVMNSFAWSSSALRNGNLTVRRGLLRSKALSLLYCNPRCPILSAFALRFIDLTNGYDEVLSTSFWDQKILSEKQTYSAELLEERRKGISYQDRLDFDALYDISPETQILIEAEISSFDLGPINSDLIDSLYGHDFWVYRDVSRRFTGPKEIIEV